MAKKKLSPKPLMYPKPVVLVGALVKGKPNFMTIANCGIVAWAPPMLFVCSWQENHTNAGIKRQKTFSVNIPSARMAKITDFCGIYSGRKIDKSKIFQVFFGKLKTAPMIKECPVNLECKLKRLIRFREEEVFLGEIVAIYADEQCLVKNQLDIKRINPLIYSTSDKKYFKIGSEIGKAYHLGRKM